MNRGQCGQHQSERVGGGRGEGKGVKRWDGVQGTPGFSQELGLEQPLLAPAEMLGVTPDPSPFGLGGASQ